jgi:hypothetical protein
MPVDERKHLRIYDMRQRDIETAIEECTRFATLAERHLEDEAEPSTPEDEADIRRYALDAIRSLRKLRESVVDETVES